MIANKTFNGKLRKIKAPGKCVKNTSKDTISPTDVEKMYKEYLIPYYKTNPRVLQHKVYYEICYYMARRDNENLTELTKNKQSPGQVMAGRGDVGPGSSDGRAPDM